MLRKALAEAGIQFDEIPGEAAFYGPKIDVQVLDSAGRELSLATVQVDFVQPSRLGLNYVDSGGAQVAPVMVHRSIVGSLERLFAHLIEVHEGAFPVWYAPVQVLVLPVGQGQDAAARAFQAACVGDGLRVEIASDGSLGARVRDAARRKVPYVAVIGAREAAAAAAGGEGGAREGASGGEGAVSLRLRDGRELPPQPVAAALALIRDVVESRSLALLPAAP